MALNVNEVIPGTARWKVLEAVSRRRWAVCAPELQRATRLPYELVAAALVWLCDSGLVQVATSTQLEPLYIGTDAGRRRIREGGQLRLAG